MMPVQRGAAMMLATARVCGASLFCAASLASAPSAQAQDILDPLGCWDREWQSGHGRFRNGTSFCFVTGGVVHGATIEALHGHDWMARWRPAGPGSLAIDENVCSFRLDADGQILRLSECGGFSGEWRRARWLEVCGRSLWTFSCDDSERARRP